MRAHERLFERIDIDTVAEAVVAQIEQLIISGVLKSGQKLPAERELAELMDVSRPKVRDAIQVLEARGLLKVRHGDGTFVNGLTGMALAPAMVDLFARHPRAFGDYLEFRREVEGFAAFLAAQRATASDRQIIEQTLTDMQIAHADPDPKRESDLDVRLHTAIVDAAHNAMLGQMMASIYDLMTRGVFYNRDFLYGRGDARERLLEQHLAIASGVLDGDPERAAAAAEAHMDFVSTSFRVGRADEERDRVARKRLVLMDLAQEPARPPRRPSPA
ncbi:MAG: FadR/GntR family transcriptional regulator [Pseudomonadota bacterium]